MQICSKNNANFLGSATNFLKFVVSLHWYFKTKLSYLYDDYELNLQFLLQTTTNINVILSPTAVQFKVYSCLRSEVSPPPVWAWGMSPIFTISILDQTALVMKVPRLMWLNKITIDIITYNSAHVGARFEVYCRSLEIWTKFAACRSSNRN